jgi:hypothetical protein
MQLMPVILFHVTIQQDRHANIILRELVPENSLTVGEMAIWLGLPDAIMPKAENSNNWWHFNVFGLKIYCYNFKWRQQALAYHDLHHVVTGHPCTMRGEMQVATWEFAAGRFPNIFSNLFCLPLVALGTLIIPRKTFRAFESGKLSKSLFGKNIPNDIGNWPRNTLVAMTTKNNSITSPIQNIMGFAALSALSFLEITVLTTPIILTFKVLAGLR